MVQVDIFWSYGLASGLTLAAGKKLAREKEPFGNKYFSAILTWISVFFAPSGAYLLWVFPSWETMFVAHGQGSIPGWLVALFAASNVSQGILGYYVTWRFLRAGNQRAARLQTIWSHAAMLFILVCGWDGTGWQRFTHTRSAADFAGGVTNPWYAFFSPDSPVFMTLLAMGVILVPTYAWLCVRFARVRSTV